MSSLGGILSNARSAIFAHQAAMQVASHNISNAQTEGYSRQRAVLTPGWPQRSMWGPLGTGVSLTEVQRVRDVHNDHSVRREGGRADSYGLRRDLLASVETVFGEPSETGLASVMDAFWNSWADLANQPTSGTARTMVQQRGLQVANAFNFMAERLNEIEFALRARLSDTISQLNGLTEQITQVSQEIVSAEAAGQSAGDLRDLRDRLVDSLSKIGVVTVVEHTDRTVSVLVDGAPLVEGFGFQKVSNTLGPGGTVIVRSNGQPMTFPAEGSVLGEMVDFLNNGLPGVRATLDELARGMVLKINEIHEQGHSIAGTGIRFFEQPADPSTITARNISLSAAVRADANAIAASSAPNAEGNNVIALQLAALRDDVTVMPDGAGTTSLGGFYRNLVGDVALRVSSAENSHTVFAALARQAELRRESASGVSTDEELVRLIQHQQAYTAATRLVKTVDEMIQSLLNMV